MHFFSKMSITAQILLWSLVLVFIFSMLTIYFFHGIHDLVTATDDIVNKDFKVVSNSKELVDNTLLFVENWRKFEILEEQKYYEESLEHLETLKKILKTLPDNFHPSELEIDKVEVNLDNDSINPTFAFLVDQQAMSQWIKGITQVRNEYLQSINQQMQDMFAQGTQLQNYGLLGLSLATFFSLAGSLAIAYFLNRSMRELRRGISRVTKREDFIPVKVVSQGELGQLARAFNEMGARLKREEEMRSEFISMLSHEIRTPLTSIRESVNLVQEELADTTPPEHLKFLEIAHKETLRLSDLFQRLMQAASLGSRELNLKPESIQIRTLFEEAVDRVQPVAERAEITLQIAEDQALISADFDHVQQVLFNLLGNAAKVSPPGSTVSIGIDILKDRKMVQVCVQDQGPGIPDQEKDLIFERYYRAQDTRGITDGAGLGLYISRHIVKAHGGELWVEDASPRGSVFCFTLPLAREGEGGSDLETERMRDGGRETERLRD